VIDELVREGARRMLAEALAAEVDADIAQFRDERDERGRRLVVRNGSHQTRKLPLLYLHGAPGPDRPLSRMKASTTSPRIGRISPTTIRVGDVQFGGQSPAQVVALGVDGADGRRDAVRRAKQLRRL
jgi:hypothetical protein